MVNKWNIILFSMMGVSILFLSYIAVNNIHDSKLCKNHFLEINKDDNYHNIKCYIKDDINLKWAKNIQCQCNAQRIIVYNENTKEIFYKSEIRTFFINPEE